MVLNLDTLKKAHQFKFKTKSLGELLCQNFTLSVMREAAKWLSDNDKKDSIEFARYLTTLLCQPVDKEGGEDNRINIDQAKSLNQCELAEFSSLLIERNGFLLEDQDKRGIIQKEDKEGDDHISYKLVKRNDESEVDHLLRVVDVYISQTNKRTKKLFKSGTKNFYSSATLDLLAENQRISKSLGSSLIHHEAFKLPEMPENPIFETNRQLASFGRELNEVSFLIKNMNDLGVQMAMDSAVATARTKFWNNVMFGLGLITLAVTAFFSYLSYVSSDDSSSQVEDLLIEQNKLLATQGGNQKKLIEAIFSVSLVLETELVHGENQEQMLKDISAQLEHITSQSSSQPSAARMPLSGAYD